MVKSAVGGTDTLTGIEALHFDDGTVEVRSSSPLVDNLFYDQKYADVLHAGLDPAAHYYAHGAQEGRDPNAWFDDKGYLAANPAVANAHIDPLVHYLQYGAFELCDPHSDGVMAHG